MRFFITLAVLTLTISPLANAQAPYSLSCRDGASQTQFSDLKNGLTPEALGMSRDKISLRRTHAPNLQWAGAVSIRDKSVTGLEGLQFPPIDFSGYRFSLSFKDAQTGTLIQDTVPDYFDRTLQAGEGPSPLGPQFWAGNSLCFNLATCLLGAQLLYPHGHL